MNLPQEYILLLLLLLLGLVTKNQTIIISVAILSTIKLLGLETRLFPKIDKYGIRIGVTIIMLAVLVPIASGDIKFVELTSSIKTPYGVISIIAGIFVAILGASGLNLLDKSPQATISIVIGVILAIIFLKGIPVGPLIGAGIASILFKLYDFIKSIFLE